MVQSQQQLTKRTVLVALIVLAILLGAGVGVIDQSGMTLLADDESTPTGPTVNATPPGTETPTETPNGTATSSSGTGSGADTTATESQTPAGISGSISVDATDPEDVSNGAGHVTSLRGDVSATAEWQGSVDSAVVVVSSFSSVDGWSEIRRTTLEPENESITLEEAFDSTGTRYLAGERAAAYNNPHDGTTVTRTSYVGVTVVLFEGGEEVGRLTETSEYSFDVTNVDASDGTNDGSSDGTNDGSSDGTNDGSSDGTNDGNSDATDDGNSDVTIDPGQPELRTGSVADSATDGIGPGTTGNQSVSVKNAGDASGTLRVFLENATGSENGFAEPEAEVDGDQESELLQQLEIRIAVVAGSGENYLLGGPDEYVSLTGPALGEVGSVSLPAGESRTVVVEWKIPTSAGNEIMTDTASWDLRFVLESDDSGG